MHPAKILYHITVAQLPTERIRTTRGLIPYLQWLEEEKARIEKKSGWPVVIYRNPRSGEVSLVHLKVSASP